MADNYLYPPLCANVKDGVQCQKMPTIITCSRCLLVHYCSENCQAEYAATHNEEVCNIGMMSVHWKPDWAKAKRIPKFADGSEDPTKMFGPHKYLWGNMHAIDLINIKKNEGISANDGDFSIMCAASGDLRNILKTVANLPDNYTGQCSIVMNDIDFEVVARNAIFLLCALYLTTEDAIPTIIHLWYSAYLPPPIYAMLQNKILPIIEDVCNKIKDSNSGRPIGKTWKTASGQTLRLVLCKANWNRLAAFLKVPNGMTFEAVEALRQSRMNLPARRDYMHKTAYGQWPAFRTCNQKFREDGILLPFGASRKGFNIPNPTMLQSLPNWPFRDDAEPHCGWSHQDVLRGVSIAKEDMLGSLFSLLRDLLFKFCTHVRDYKMKFRLYCMDARILPAKFIEWKEENLLYDRIEVSNISDRGYVGPSLCISLFAPLLKPISVNPHACLLLLFQGAVVEMDHFISSDQRMRDTMAANPRRYMRMPTHTTPGWDPMIYKFVQCADGLRDWDKSWALFENKVGFPAMVAKAGLKMRDKAGHKLVKAWPKRLSKGGSQQEFDLCVAKNSTGFERYVELVRKE